MPSPHLFKHSWPFGTNTVTHTVSCTHLMSDTTSSHQGFACANRSSEELNLMMTGTLRQTVGRWFSTTCSKCVEPSVIKNRKAHVALLPGALFSLLGYFQEPRFSPCGWSGRAWGPSENVLKWQQGRDCCAHLLWTQVTAPLLMGPRALVTSQICRPALRKCSPRTISER